MEIEVELQRALSFQLRLKPFFKNNGLCSAHLNGLRTVPTFPDAYVQSTVVSLSPVIAIRWIIYWRFRRKNHSSGSSFSSLSSDVSGKNFLFCRISNML